MCSQEVGLFFFFLSQTQMDIYKRFIKPSLFISLCILGSLLCFSSFVDFSCIKNALYDIGGNGGIIDEEHKCS